MGYQIIFSPQSLSDLERIVRHISRDAPFAAERIGNALIDRVMILENFPQLGPAYAKRPNVRKLVSHPYIIFYRINANEQKVEILRYWHGARENPVFRD